MVTKKRSVHTTSTTFNTSSLNFRPNVSGQEDRKGTRPTGTEPHSVSFVLLSLIIHICKKYLLLNVTRRIAIYCAFIFFGSVLVDLMPVPKSYFSQSDNILNRYFIKWGWAWLLIIAGPWMTLVAYTVGCGRKSYIWKHLARLLVATLSWMLWMRIFHYTEQKIGRCLKTQDPLLQNRVRCLKSGLFWQGLDISGHTFIIIYTTLILSEEGAAFIGWERIRDWINTEKHTRTIEGEISNSSLRNLSDEDLEFLQKAHNKLSPYLRGLFIVMTVQQVLWDIMLMATVLYYHTIVEKLSAMTVAFFTWYVTYQMLFRVTKIGFLSPGDGLFKYIEQKKEIDLGRFKRGATSNRTQTATFMGRTLGTGFKGGDR